MPSPRLYSVVVYCYRGQTVNADSPVSCGQGILTSYVFFVILVAGASFHLYLRSKQVKMVAGLNRAISDYLTMASRDIVIPQCELFATWA